MKKLLFVPLILLIFSCVNGESNAQQNPKLKNAQLISVIDGIMLYRVVDRSNEIYITVSNRQGVTSAISIQSRIN